MIMDELYEDLKSDPIAVICMLFGLIFACYYYFIHNDLQFALLGIVLALFGKIRYSNTQTRRKLHEFSEILEKLENSFSIKIKDSPALL